MLSMRFFLRLCIYATIIFTFFLGLPQIHYVAALMVAIMIRHKDEPKGIFGPLKSTELELPIFPKTLELQSYDLKAKRIPSPTEKSLSSQDKR